jgi:hypothetical protein
MTKNGQSGDAKQKYLHTRRERSRVSDDSSQGTSAHVILQNLKDFGVQMAEILKMG